MPGEKIEKKPLKTTALKTDYKDHRLEDMLYDLEDSKTRHHSSVSSFFRKKDSEEYTAVKDRLRYVVQNLQGGFSEDAKANEQMMLTVSQGYYRLMNACENYLAKKGGTTSSGQARKAKVQAILETAQDDIGAVQQSIFDVKQMPKEQQAQLSWQDILHSARAATIEVDDYFDEEKNILLGGAAKVGNKKARLFDNGVFSPEEAGNMKDTVFVSNAFNTSGKNSDMKKVFDIEKETFHHSNRNVATSRVANLIGAGGLVEQSKTVKIHDKKSDKIIKGNLMTKAKGEDAQKVSERFVENVAMETDNIVERSDKVSDILAPSIQKELSSLQVLDYLCGQGDRNHGNYFLEYDEKKKQYTHIHGIDNDMSFGSGVDYEEHLKNQNGFSMLKLRMVVDSEDNLVIPHMDIQLAQNIKNLSEDELRFALKDLIEPGFIEAAVQRLNKLKRAIAKEEAKKDSRVFLQESEWGKATHEEFLNKSRAAQMEEKLKEKGVDKDIFTPVKNLGNREDAEDIFYKNLSTGSYYDELATKMMGYVTTSATGNTNYFQRKQREEEIWEASIDTENIESLDMDPKEMVSVRNKIETADGLYSEIIKIGNLINMKYVCKSWLNLKTDNYGDIRSAEYTMRRINYKFKEIEQMELYGERELNETDFKELGMLEKELDGVIEKLNGSLNTRKERLKELRSKYPGYENR